MKNLVGKQLTVLSISRKGMFDENSFVFCCDNCGRAIVNYAQVNDGIKDYIIGLDCKKTLIDKPKLSELLKNVSDWEVKYKTKEFNSELNEVNKFLLESSREGVTFDIDYKTNWLSITDPKQESEFFKGIFGKTIYSQSIGFLERMGLKDYIKNLSRK